MKWMCKRLRNPNQMSWRQLVKTVRYMGGTEDSSEAYFAGDWACDDIDRKSASGGYLMVGGCRLHSHSGTTGQHALGSGESEIMHEHERVVERSQIDVTQS